MARDLPFAVHGISELSLRRRRRRPCCSAPTSSSGSLVGSLIAALAHRRCSARGRASATRSSAVLMPFGLGLGILCLALYPGRSRQQVRPADRPDRVRRRPAARLARPHRASSWSALLLVWRPLTVRERRRRRRRGARRAGPRPLARVHAAARRSPCRSRVQIVGALLVLSLLVTPAAAALRVSSVALRGRLLSMVFAVVSHRRRHPARARRGVPISPYVTTISFLIYLVCRGIELGARASRRGRSGALGLGTAVKRQHLAARGRARGARRPRGLRQRAVAARARCETAAPRSGSPPSTARSRDLAAEGDADSLQSDGESLYRACTPGGHHHHLICRICGRTVEIAADPVEHWAARGRRAQRLHATPQHVVDVFGLCAECTRRAADAASADASATAAEAPASA